MNLFEGHVEKKKVLGFYRKKIWKLFVFFISDDQCKLPSVIVTKPDSKICQENSEST